MFPFSQLSRIFVGTRLTDNIFPPEHIEISLYDFRGNRSTSVGRLRDLMSNSPPSLILRRNIHRPWNGMTLLEVPRGLANFWRSSNCWNIHLPKIMAFLLCRIPKIPVADRRLWVPVRIKVRFFLCPWESDLLYRNIGNVIGVLSSFISNFLYLFLNKFLK